MPALALVIIGCSLMIIDAIKGRVNRVLGGWLVAIGFVLTFFFH